MSERNKKRNGELPDRLPVGKRTRSGSILLDETLKMAGDQRRAEQQGHRRLAKVHARERPEVLSEQAAPEGELQNDILQHPALDSQRFDGIDPSLNPAPELNTEARLKYDNEKREQDREKQERLENVLGLANQPKFSPKPGGP